MTDRKKSNQVVGNMGLHYVCFELSKIGWNVLPTSRNLKGIDVARKVFSSVFSVNTVADKIKTKIAI